MRHRGRAPEKHGKREADPRAEPVDQFPDEQQTCTVGKLKSEDDVAISDFGPSELRLQRWFQQADDLSVHVVDRGREEQEAADQPTCSAARIG